MEGCWSSACAEALWIVHPQKFRPRSDSSTVVDRTRPSRILTPRRNRAVFHRFRIEPEVQLQCRTMLAKHDPEAILDTALAALAEEPDWRSVLDELPMPIYIADND